MQREKFLEGVHVPCAKGIASHRFSPSLMLLCFAVAGIFIFMFLLSYGFTNWTTGAAGVQQPFAVLARAEPYDPALSFVDPNRLNASLPRCPDFAAYATGGARAPIPPLSAARLVEAAHAARDPRVYDLMSACMRAGLNISRPDDVAFARELVDAVPSDRGAGYIFGLLATRGLSAPLRVALEMDYANMRQAVVRWRAGRVRVYRTGFRDACRALFAIERFPYDMFVSEEECGNSMASLHEAVTALLDSDPAQAPAETYEYYMHEAANDTYSLDRLKGLLGPAFVAGLAAAVQDEIGRHAAEIEAAGRGVPAVAALPQWTVHTHYIAALANYTDGVAPARWRVFAQAMLLLDGATIVNDILAPEAAIESPADSARERVETECAWLAANYLPRQTDALLRAALLDGDPAPAVESVRAAFTRWVDRAPADGRTKLEFARKIHGMRVRAAPEPDAPLDGALRFPAHPSLHRIVALGRRVQWLRVHAEGFRAAPAPPLLDARAPVRYNVTTNTLDVGGVAGLGLFRAGWPRPHVMGTLGFEAARAMLGVATDGRYAPDHKGQLDANFAPAGLLYATDPASLDRAAAEIALMACDESRDAATQFMLALAQHLADEPARVNAIANALSLHGERPWCQ
jgi:hypothetical protein